MTPLFKLFLIFIIIIGSIYECHAKSRSKKDKPVIVEWKMIDDERHYRLFGYMKEWRKYGSYNNLKTANMVIAQQSRKYPWFEYRIAE